MSIELDHVTNQIVVDDAATNASIVIQPKGTGAVDLAAGSSGVNISNGGTVTAITRTATGSNYTSFPSLSISAPTTANGVQATATPQLVASGSATIISGGTGYTNGDVLTVSTAGGSGVINITVTGVTGGVITAATALSGALTSIPTGTLNVTGGTGTGATFTIFYVVAATFTITNAGSGYVEQPTVTFSGGGGSGAAAYATVGSDPIIKSLTTSMRFTTSQGEAVRITGGGATLTDYVELSGGISGVTNGVYVKASGSSTNQSLYLMSKGTSGVGLFTNWSNGATQQFQVSHTASAVNYVQVTGGATTVFPAITAQGSDTNIGLNFSSKGTQALRFNTNTADQQFRITHTAGASNYVQVTGAATSNEPQISAQGTDANISLQIASKGGNPVKFLTEGAVRQAQVSHTASAVNFVQVTGAATGSGPTISAQGSDTNAFLALTSKGTSAIRLQTGGSSQVLINNTTSAVNQIGLTGSIAGAAPQISAQGSDTNIPLVLQPKGTGALQAQLTDSTTTGGNARGANAVDWQTSRSAAANVASGAQSVVGGGGSNGASGQYSGVLSGVSCYATGFASVVSGGWQNSATGGESTVAGGYSNVASGAFNFVGGGVLNTGTASAAVTSQATTTVTSGSTAVTLSGSNASIKVGQYVTGTGMAFPTFVAAISGTSLTLSQAANATGTPTLSFYTPHGVVVGGGNNQATGSYSFIGGGGDAGTSANRNVASGDWSVVAGGQQNQATGIGSVVGGGGTIGGGTIIGNSASGTASTVAGGLSNTATGTGASVPGGYQNAANGTVSTVIGRFGTARSIIGNTVFSANNVPIATASGVSQAALLVLGVQTTDATATVLRSDSGVATTNNQVILPNNSAYYFRGEIVAGVTGGGNTKGWFIEGVIKRGANAAATALVGTPTVTSNYADAGASTWSVALTADTTNGGLAVTVTGQAATTIRWVAQIRTTEMTY